MTRYQRDEFTCGIYQIVSSSGNMYIGSTVCFEERKKAHFSLLKKRKHYNSILQNAFNKYGDELKFKTMIVCRIEDLHFYEQLFIDSYNPVYNILDTVAPVIFGRINSEETNKKMRQSKLGFKHSDKTKEKISNLQTGKKLSDEWKTNISNGHKNNPINPNPNHEGSKRSEEDKLRIRLGRLKKKQFLEIVANGF